MQCIGLILHVVYKFTFGLLCRPIFSPRANGAERRSRRKPGARVLIPSGYLHPGKRKH
jgi:hypothetical protein